MLSLNIPNKRKHTKEPKLIEVIIKKESQRHDRTSSTKHPFQLLLQLLLCKCTDCTTLHVGIKMLHGKWNKFARYFTIQVISIRMSAFFFITDSLHREVTDKKNDLRGLCEDEILGTNKVLVYHNANPLPSRYFYLFYHPISSIIATTRI